MPYPIDIDDDINNVMRAMNTCESSWSNKFLMKTCTLIQRVKMMKYLIELISHQQTPLSPVSENLLFNLFTELVRKPSIIEHYLNRWQYNVIKDVFDSGLIQSNDDFNYMVHHLPFYTELNEMLTDYIITNVKIPNIYKEYILGTYVSPIIQSWMFKNCRYIDTYQVLQRDQTQMSEQLVTIDIVHTNQQIDPMLIVKTICDINFMLQKTYQIPDINRQKPLHIIYVMTPFQKKLNYFQRNRQIDHLLITKLQEHQSLQYNYHLFNNPISNINVNTGVTVHRFDNYITLWRTEEFTKVLTHELIHYYDLEKGEEFLPLQLNISNNFPHYSKELFTEMQTWYIYTIYQLSRQSDQYRVCDIRFVLDYERAYSLTRMQRILQNFQINHLDQFLSVDQQHKINVHSSVLYYYILKAVLLSCIDPFIEDLLYPSGICDECRHKVTKFTEQRLQILLQSKHFRQMFDHLLTSYDFDDGMRMMGIKLIPLS